MAAIKPEVHQPAQLIGDKWERGLGGELTSCNPAKPSDIGRSLLQRVWQQCR